MNKLAEAVCYWLSYKAATGTAHLLTEGSLSIPIAESLFFHRWEIHAEKDYHEIFPSIVAKTIYTDFYATKENERLVLETKFFKSSSQNRVFNDIVRLGLAEADSVQRVLLRAWSSNVKPWKHFERLLSLNEGDIFTIDPVQCLFDCEGLSVVLGENKLEFEKLHHLRDPAATNKIQVTCTGVTRTKNYYGAAEYSIAPI